MAPILFRRRAALITAVGILGCARAPATAPTPLRLGSLAGEVDTIIPFTRGAPYGAAASSRGLAYVTVHGAVSALGSWDFAARRAVRFAAKTGYEPTNVAFSPDGGMAYVASQMSATVDRVPAGENGPDASWPTEGNHPYQVAVSPDGRRVYATGNAGYLYIIDALTGGPLGRVRTAGAPNGLAVSHDGRRVYLTHLLSPEVGVVDAEQGTYATFGILGGVQGQGIVLADDDRVLYAVSQSSSELCRFDVVAGTRTGCVTTAPDPFGLALTPDGRELWVTTLGGQLQRFSVEEMTLIATVELGGRLRRIAMDPGGRGAVIADERGRLVVMR